MKMSIEGGAAEELFPGSATNNAFPAISHDGKLLAYTAQSFDTENLLFKSVLNFALIKDGKFTRLDKELNLDAGYNYEWASDNKNLIFIDRQGIPNLFSVPMDGGEPKPLTNFNSGTIVKLETSRDGKRFFLVRAIVNADLILIKDNSKSA